MESTRQEERKLKSKKRKQENAKTKLVRHDEQDLQPLPPKPIIPIPDWIADNFVSLKDLIPLFFITLISGITRLWRLGYPPVVVFDEVFYTRFIHMYINRLFHFDSNPPFAKQLIAIAGYWAGYGKQNETFEKIGDEYAADTPIWALRLLPAVFGTLIVPMAYCVTRELGYSQMAAVVTAICFLFDNALVTGSRFVLTDSINLCLLLTAVFCVLRFIKQCPLGEESYEWGKRTGLFMGLVISVKYTSFNSLLILGWIVTRHYWKTIDDLTISATQLLKYLAVCCVVVFAIPAAVYTGSHYVHLMWLTKAGPYDTMMSTRFQSSLEGGMEALSMGQPFNIGHGSQITLRNVPGVNNGEPCWLHSHKPVYPVKYSDNRGSSHQQQVTCYGFKDVNNWWIVKNPQKASLEVDSPPHIFKNGDVVQLVHGITGKNLNSHDVASPMTPDCQEVSGYLDYNISVPAQDLWELQVVGQDEEDPSWHTIHSHVRFIHVGTGKNAALGLTGKQLPDWAFHQWEIVSCEPLGQTTASLWRVEEHRYITPFNDEKEREYDLNKAEFIPEKAVDMSLWNKFLELQASMLGLTKDTVEEHFYGSGPMDWIMSDIGVAYWAEKGTNKQVYQVGNVVIWQTGAVIIGLTFFLLIVIELWDLRYPESLPITIPQWNRILFTSELVLSSWVINWLPYFFTDRTLFFHHYFPGLAFKFILLGCFVGEILDRFRQKPIWASVLKAFLGVWILSVVYNFYLFTPLTYGFDELSVNELRDLEWRESWNFIIRL